MTRTPNAGKECWKNAKHFKAYAERQLILQSELEK